MAKKDNLSEKEKQKIKDDYNALYEDGVMDVLKYAGKRELKSIGEGFMPISPEEKDKARAKRSLEFSIDDEKIMNLVQTLKNKLNNIPAELREDAAKQMTRENTSPENYLPFYNLITQQGDYGPEGSKSISLGREIGSQETLPMSELPFNKLPDNEKQKRLSMLQFSVVNPERVEVSKVMSDFKNQYGEEVLAMEIDKIKKDFVAGKLDSFKMAQDNIKPKNMGGLVGYANGGNMSIQQQTQNVANQGRYGDSMLLHVNPAEVKGLAQAMPITVNPETGQPEAFLPFLAPLLGSALGTTFLTGLGATAATAAGAAATTGISSALAAGLGAGLATYAQTGGSGSKALLSGLTAGFGTSAANTGAQAAQTSSDIAAGVAGGMTPEAAAQAAAAATPRVSTSFLGSAKDMFKQGVDATGVADGSFAFDEGAKALASAAMTPSGMMAGAGLGGRGIINSQELFAQQMRQLEIDEEQRKRDMYANNPEIQLYSASGGMTQFQHGGDTDHSSESGRQVFAPAKQQYAVNPNFMAGFAPETMYFRPDTVNAPSSSTRGGTAPTLGADTYTGTKGGYDYEGTVDADGNYVAGTAQGVQFAPQTSIDPYAKFTGSAPQGLVQSAYNPYPAQPMSMSPINDTTNTTNTEDTSDYGGTDGNDYYQGYSANSNKKTSTNVPTNSNEQTFASTLDILLDNATDSAGNPITDSPYDAYDPEAVADVRDDYSDYFFDYEDIQDFYRDEVQGVMDRKAGGDTDMPNKGLEALNKVAPDAVANMGYEEGGETDFRQDPMTQQVIAFLIGDSDNTEIVDMFVDKYGSETFMALREMILNPDNTKQTEGLITGVGNSGMADDLLGSIGNKEKIAVSQDEFIVPADVVSGLGDGSSDAGSKELYSMMDRVRQKRTGTTKQPTMLANAGGLLPA